MVGVWLLTAQISLTSLVATNNWTADLSQRTFSRGTLKLNPGDSNQALRGEEKTCWGLLVMITFCHNSSKVDKSHFKSGRRANLWRLRGEKEKGRCFCDFPCSFSTIGSMTFYGLSWNSALCFPKKHSLYFYIKSASLLNLAAKMLPW